MRKKLTFSGHETFYCRYLWLKKGYEFVKKNGSFRDEHATVKLGVGKNMVNSIRFWMIAFGIIDSKGFITPFAKTILDNRGFDPYLEQIGSVWLLHYNIIKTNYASIYSIFFNRFRRQYYEFSNEQFLSYLIGECKNDNFRYSENTLKSDIEILIKSYKKPDSKKALVEEDYTSLLSELNLISEVSVLNNSVFKAENFLIDQLDINILLYAILDNFENSISISIEDLLNGSIGNIFLLNKENLNKKLIEASEKYKKFISYKDDAGVKELQIKSDKLDKHKLLEDYYAN